MVTIIEFYKARSFPGRPAWVGLRQRRKELPFPETTPRIEQLQFVQQRCELRFCPPVDTAVAIFRHTTRGGE